MSYQQPAAIMADNLDSFMAWASRPEKAARRVRRQRASSHKRTRA